MSKLQFKMITSKDKLKLKEQEELKSSIKSQIKQKLHQMNSKLTIKILAQIKMVMFQAKKITK